MAFGSENSMKNHTVNDTKNNSKISIISLDMLYNIELLKRHLGVTYVHLP